MRGAQRGIGLVAAIFVITVMALISVGLSQLVVTGQQGYGYQVLSARAFLAAESGAQLAANQLMPPEGGGGSGCPLPNPPLPAEGSGGCEVRLACNQVGPLEVQGRLTTYYTLQSEGRCGSGKDLAIRRLTLRFQRPE
ncbi:hypothetical protein [Motiliproteus sp. SC1-56]|uniref:hypothetical protein n=1 Tax=Motiliproteus sp. SC1-56 TaxID=2799565 RepID=UPI001A8CF7C7|nr:hypothetical protein [Motiliproteus sp. SC1-56]